MYLKESFRYQNYLSELIDCCIAQLTASKNITKTVQTHMKNKANPEAQDEIIDLSTERTIAYTADQIVDFMTHLVGEKEALTAAVSKAKTAASVDLDAEISNNKVRQKVFGILNRMANTKATERMTRASGFKFNAEGNQVQYTYDVKEVTTIDFDRNKIRGLARSMVSKSDEVSTTIDKVVVDTVVDYDPKYSINDSFDDAMEQFLTAG